jgi:hypothetical protein
LVIAGESYEKTERRQFFCHPSLYRLEIPIHSAMYLTVISEEMMRTQNSYLPNKYGEENSVVVV